MEALGRIHSRFLSKIYVLLATMVDQVMLTHWVHRIRARGNPQEEDVVVFLNAMEEIIDDVPPSYR